MTIETDQAAAHIRRGTTRWHDFCSEHGMISANVRHMLTVIEMFAEWLEQNP